MNRFWLESLSTQEEGTLLTEGGFCLCEERQDDTVNLSSFNMFIL